MRVAKPKFRLALLLCSFMGLMAFSQDQPDEPPPQFTPFPPLRMGYVPPPPDPALGMPADKKAEEVYANIKALNGVPYGEVIPGMQVMSEALGVECEHCHAESGDRDLEGNPNKDIAREMIRMVRDLNQRNFGGRNVIGCNTCHRGRAKPSDGLSLDARLGDVPNNVAAAESSLPSASQVIDQYIQALGGEELAVQRVPNYSRTEHGVVTIVSDGNSSHRFRIMSSSSGNRRTDGFTVSHLGNSESAFGVITGEQGWMRESNGPIRLMFGWRRDAARLEDIFNLPRRLRRLQDQLRVARAQEISGRKVWVVSGSTEYISSFEYYFDEETGLLLRLVYFVDSIAGKMPSRIDYSDYRIEDTQKLPFHWDVTLVRGVKVSYQVNSVQTNRVARITAFELPDPPPLLYR